MTCIAGVAKAGKVWIGGDCAGVEANDIWAYNNPKVFKRGEFVYGFAGEWRGGQVLQYSFKEPEHKKTLTDIAYLVGPYIDAVRKSGIVLMKDESPTACVNWLLGYRGKLYSVEDDLAILEHVAGYDAIGSGRQFALGALNATPTMPPALRVRKALEASATHCSTVTGPFTVLSLGSKT